MKAKESNQFLRITYKVNDQTYTNILHSSEIVVNREWVNGVVSVEVFAINENVNKITSLPLSEILVDQPARERLANLTNQNNPDLFKHHLNNTL